MVQRKFPRGYKVYLPLFLMLVFFVFMLPRSPRFSYEYKKGEHWMYETLVAEFDFPILKTDEQLKAEKDSVRSVKIPYFDKKYSVKDSSLVRLERSMLDNGIDTLDASVHGVVENALKLIYSKGVFDPNDGQQYKDKSEDAVCVLILDGNTETKVPVAEVFSYEAAREYIRASLHEAGIRKADSLYALLDVKSFVSPDLKFNSGVTEERFSDRLHHPSYTSNYMSRSEVIVEKGEIVTDQVANLLDSYKAEFDKSVGYSGTGFAMWTGLLLVALALVVVFFFTLYFCDYDIFGQFNRYMYVLLLYVLFSSITFLLSREDVEMYYMIPYSLMAMFMMAFFRKGFVIHGRL